MRPRFTFDSLVPGMGFGFSGPRRFLVLPGGVAIGQVVGLEPHSGIVHVRTFRPGSDPERHRPDIGFIPMLFTSFRRSVRFLHAHGPVPNDVWPVLSTWRERHALGQVGAFVRPLWQVEEMVWQTVQESEPTHNPDNTYIEYAFVKLAPGTTTFSVVEVSGVPIVPTGTA